MSAVVLAFNLPKLSPHALTHPTYALKLVFVGVMGFAALMIGLAALGHRKQTRHDVGAPGLYGVVGAMGRGKSYFLAWMASGAGGRIVFANYHLPPCIDYLDFRQAHPYEWVEVSPGKWATAWGCGCVWREKRTKCEGGSCVAPGVSVHVFVPPTASGGWGSICQAPFGSLVLIDEVHTWWPSHRWRAPEWLMAWCSQLRKRELTVVWASQHYSFIAKRLVLLTFGIWQCERYRRGHRYSLYEAVGFGTAKAIRLTRMNVVRRKAVMASYDTTEIVGGVEEWADSPDEESADLALMPRAGGPGPPGL